MDKKRVVGRSCSNALSKPSLTHFVLLYLFMHNLKVESLA